MQCDRTVVSHPQQPQPTDAVLGGAIAPLGLVLGGLEGVQQRLRSQRVAERVAAVWEASRYGDQGVDLLAVALADPAIAVQKAAYQVLRQYPPPVVQAALEHFSPYQLFEEQCVLTGHQGGITAIALSSDGNTLVSSGRDRVLRVWDLEAREPIFVIEEPSLVFSITISPDDDVFLTRSKDQTVKIWSLRNGQLFDLPREEDLNLHLRTISSVTVTAGQHLISGSQNTVRIWDLKQGRETRVLRGHTSLVTAVAVCLAHQRIASGSEDRTVRIWGLT